VKGSSPTEGPGEVSDGPTITCLTASPDGALASDAIILGLSPPDSSASVEDGLAQGSKEGDSALVAKRASDLQVETVGNGIALLLRYSR
jgi:hypothetical protein